MKNYNKQEKKNLIKDNPIAEKGSAIKNLNKGYKSELGKSPGVVFLKAHLGFTPLFRRFWSKIEITKFLRSPYTYQPQRKKDKKHEKNQFWTKVPIGLR